MREKILTAKRISAFVAFLTALTLTVGFFNWQSVRQRRQAALIATSLSGNTSRMRLLLSVGAKANEPACEAAPCVRPLVAAALCDCPNAVQLLLDNGAAINDRSYRGQTALSIAAYEGHTETIRLLLSRGADPNLEWEGLTPLEWARRQHHQGAIDLLERGSLAR